MRLQFFSYKVCKVHTKSWHWRLNWLPIKFFSLPCYSYILYSNTVLQSEISLHVKIYCAFRDEKTENLTINSVKIVSMQCKNEIKCEKFEELRCPFQLLKLRLCSNHRKTRIEWFKIVIEPTDLTSIEIVPQHVALVLVSITLYLWGGSSTQQWSDWAV